MKEFGIDVYGYDPLLSKEEMEDFDIKALDFSFSTNLFFKRETFTKEKLFLSTGSFS